MADEKHPMDEQLKDFAQQRKAAAGRPEMHPATRKMLQGEVARVYKNEQQAFLGEEPKRSWFLQLWPRLAFGLLTLGFLVFAVILSQPSPESTEMAQANAPDTNLKFQELEQIKEKQDKDMVLLKRQIDIPQPSAPAAATAEPQFGAAPADLAKKEALASQNEPIDAPSRLPAVASTRASESKQLADSADLTARAQPLPRLEERSLALTPAPVQKPDTKVVQTELQEERSNVHSRVAAAELRPEPGVRGLAAQGALSAKVEALRDAEQPTPAQAFNFSQAASVYRRNFQSPPRQQVLQNFNLWFAGNSVTISEPEGNTYQGQLIGNKVEASGIDKKSGQRVQITGILEGLEQQTNVQFRGNAAVGRTIVPIEASSQTLP